MIRVLLADDQPLVRVGFAAILRAQPDIDVVGAAADGRDLLGLVRRLRPDVLLVDVRMPYVDGLAATRAIAGDPDLAGVRVVVVTAFEPDGYACEASHAGASGVLTERCEPADLVRVVRAAAAGRTGPDALTGPEREIVTLIGHGLDNDEIVERLGLSPAAVRTHASRAMMIVGARDRAQLVVFAYESGLVRVGHRAPPLKDERVDQGQKHAGRRSNHALSPLIGG